MEYIERVIQLRKKHGENRTELAKAIGLDPEQLRQYELGVATMPLIHIPRIAEHYGVTPDYILEGNDLDDNGGWDVQVCTQGKYDCKFLLNERCTILIDTSFGERGCTFYKPR